MFFSAVHSRVNHVWIRHIFFVILRPTPRERERVKYRLVEFIGTNSEITDDWVENYGDRGETMTGGLSDVKEDIVNSRLRFNR